MAVEQAGQQASREIHTNCEREEDWQTESKGDWESENEGTTDTCVELIKTQGEENPEAWSFYLFNLGIKIRKQDTVSLEPESRGIIT